MGLGPIPPESNGEPSEYQTRANAEHELRKEIQAAMVEVDLASSSAELRKARKRLRTAEKNLSLLIEGRAEGQASSSTS